MNEWKAGRRQEHACLGEHWGGWRNSIEGGGWGGPKGPVSHAWVDCEGRGKTMENLKQGMISAGQYVEAVVQRMNQEGQGKTVICELRGAHPLLSCSPAEGSAVRGSGRAAGRPRQARLPHALNGLSVGSSASS